jgi:O-acetylserine/cysteine efflux transporter
MPRKHQLLALALSIVFGIGWVFGKAALNHFPPILLATFRFGVAALVMFPFYKWPQIKFEYLILLSVLAITIPYSLSNYGLSQLDVSVTVLLTQLETPILIAMSLIFLREVPGRLVIVGVAISFVGVLLVVGKPVASGNFDVVIMTLISIVVWVAGQLMVRKLGVASSFGLLGALSLLATPQLLVLSTLLELEEIRSILTASLASWVQVIYLGVIMTAGGIGIWYFLISRYEINLVAPFLLLVPAVSIFGGIFFLGEVPSAGTIFGGILIMFGVVVTTVNRSESTPNFSSERKV